MRNIFLILTQFFFLFFFSLVFAPLAVAAETWTTSSSMNAPRFYHSSVIVGNYIYVLGGADATHHVGTVERAPINPDGSLGLWATTSAMTTSRMHPAASTYNGYIYVSGGEQSDGTGPMVSVERSRVGPDGLLEPWQVISEMPWPRQHHTMVIASGYIYVIGGYIGTSPATANVERSKLTEDGLLGPWEDVASLNQDRASFASAVKENNLLIAGGNTSAYETTNSIERGKIDSETNLLSWDYQNAMNSPRSYLGAATLGDYMYAAGGTNNSGPLNSAERAKIGSDGSLSAWEAIASMNSARKGLGLAASADTLYATGGWESGPEPLATVEYLRIPMEPPPPTGPDPVVFLPGIGGSFSFKGLVLNQETTYQDWTLVPRLADPYYKPLLNSLKNAGLTDSGDKQNLFIFAYDYRKSIADSAGWLNDFLEKEVRPKNPGKKIDLVGHSMGGMVASYCFLLTPGCKAKIDKIVYGGSPLKGTAEIYDFWEAGKIDEKDLMLRTAERLLLQLSGFPKVNPREIVQTKMPGARDILPIYDYKNSTHYDDPSFSPKNPVLESVQTEINKPDTAFENSLLALSGNKLKTLSSFSTKTPNKREQLLGWWVDGKPAKSSMEIGDNTVLKTSSEVGSAQNNYYPIDHAGYFRNAKSITDVLAFLGFNSPSSVLETATPRSVMVIYSIDDVKVRVLDDRGQEIGQNDQTERAVFLMDPPKKLKRLIISGKSNTGFKLKSLYVDLSSEPSEQERVGRIKRGQTKEEFFL